MAILSWFIGSAVLYWLPWVIYARWLHPYSKYPGPFFASISRLWYMREIVAVSDYQRQRQLHQKYGPIVRIAPDEVVIADPSALKTIYGVKPGFPKSDFFGAFQPPFPRFPELFTAKDPEYHASRRRIVNHIYTMSNVVRSERRIDACSQTFLQRMREVADKGEPTNIGEWVRWYSFDVIGELFFSQHFGFLEKKADYNGWISAIDDLAIGLTLLAVAPTYARPVMWGLAACIPSVAKSLSAFQMFESATEWWMKKKDTPVVDEERKDMFAGIVKIMEEKGDKVDFGPTEVKAEIHTALIAGSDTSSTAITAILYFLLKHPKTYLKLRDEIDTKAKQGQLSFPHITYHEASQLPYLDACCKEGVRLIPSIGMSISRDVPSGGQEIAGHFFPGGLRVGMNPNTVHRDREIFGQDADEYRPERWLEGDAAKMDKHILQFSSGPRTCIGKNIALCQIYKFVPELLRSFDLELASPTECTVTSTWLNKMSKIPVRVTARKLQFIMNGGSQAGQVMAGDMML